MFGSWTIALPSPPVPVWLDAGRGTGRRGCCCRVPLRCLSVCCVCCRCSGAELGRIKQDKAIYGDCGDNRERASLFRKSNYSVSFIALRSNPFISENPVSPPNSHLQSSFLPPSPQICFLDSHKSAHSSPRNGQNLRSQGRICYRHPAHRRW